MKPILLLCNKERTKMILNEIIKLTLFYKQFLTINNIKWEKVYIKATDKGTIFIL